MHGQTD
jgi:hypothetical protein